MLKYAQDLIGAGASGLGIALLVCLRWNRKLGVCVAITLLYFALLGICVAITVVQIPA